MPTHFEDGRPTNDSVVHVVRWKDGGSVEFVWRAKELKDLDPKSVSRKTRKRRRKGNKEALIFLSRAECGKQNGRGSLLIVDCVCFVVSCAIPDVHFP